MHEQSETVQADDGQWINVYGRRTPKAGKRLPRKYRFERDEYATVDSAERAAIRRSKYEGMSPAAQERQMDITIRMNGRRRDDEDDQDEGMSSLGKLARAVGPDGTLDSGSSEQGKRTRRTGHGVLTDMEDSARNMARTGKSLMGSSDSRKAAKGANALRTGKLRHRYMSKILRKIEQRMAGGMGQ